MQNSISALALKHEAFVLALMTGLTAADAARKVGYGRKNANVRIIAWRLLQREDVQARLRDLAEAATDEAIMTVIQRKIRLSEMIRENYMPIECIQLLNLMDGIYKQKKVLPEVATTINMTVEPLGKVSIQVDEHQEDNIIEDSEMNRGVADLCSESPMIG